MRPVDATSTSERGNRKRGGGEGWPCPGASSAALVAGAGVGVARIDDNGAGRSRFGRAGGRAAPARRKPDWSSTFPATRGRASARTARPGLVWRPYWRPLPVPRRLMSQHTPAARNPAGAVTEPAIFWNRDFFTSAKDKSANPPPCQ